MRAIPLIRCLPKMLPSSSTHTGSQIATWRRSLTWTRREFSFKLQSPLTGKIFVWQHQRFSLNPAQHDILPHRQSQLSELTIRLHITTSLKSISQKRWLYHLTFKRSTIYNNVTWPLQSVIQIHKYVIFRHQLTDLSKTNIRSPAATVLQRKASMQQIGLPISASN